MPAPSRRSKKKAAEPQHVPPTGKRARRRLRYCKVTKPDGTEVQERVDPDWQRTQAIADLYGNTPMLSTGANMRTIASLLTEVAGALRVEEAAIAPELMARAWRTAAGDFLATQAELSSLSEGCAVVRTAHPAVRFELQRRKQQLIRSLNDTLGEGCVRTVRIIHG